MNVSLKIKIQCLVLFIFTLIKKILKRKRFIPLSPPFVLNQIFWDRINNNFFNIKTRNHSDWTTIREIFYSEDYDLTRFQRSDEIKKLYNSLISENLTPLIIDCGSHIGLATNYFSKIYPKSKIISIEPDLNNFELSKLNNANNQNCEFLNCAIGSDVCRGIISNPNSDSNALKIEKSNNGNINIISINSIIEKKKYNEFPFIIKIDVEGFEHEIFSQNTNWITTFPIIIIEPHDWLFPKQNTFKNFLYKISKYDRDFICFGDNIFSISNNLTRN